MTLTQALLVFTVLVISILTNFSVGRHIGQCITRLEAQIQWIKNKIFNIERDLKELITEYNYNKTEIKTDTVSVAVNINKRLEEIAKTKELLEEEEQEITNQLKKYKPSYDTGK